MKLRRVSPPLSPGCDAPEGYTRSTGTAEKAEKSRSCVMTAAPWCRAVAAAVRPERFWFRGVSRVYCCQGCADNDGEGRPTDVDVMTSENAGSSGTHATPEDRAHGSCSRSATANQPGGGRRGGSRYGASHRPGIEYGGAALVVVEGDERIRVRASLPRHPPHPAVQGGPPRRRPARRPRRCRTPPSSAPATTAAGDRPDTARRASRRTDSRMFRREPARQSTVDKRSESCRAFSCA